MRVLSFLTAEVAILIATPAAAHPHAWIDVSVDVLFDASGRVTGLRQTWLFDEFYTADTVQKGERDKMDRLVARILGNLRDYGYFTAVTANGKSVPLGTPADASARMEGRRLSMSFSVPLIRPTPVPLGYSVFDPFYYIEMLHAERADAVHLSHAPTGCRTRLVPAKPSPKEVAAAAALDRTQYAGANMGILFAEKVEIRCDANP